MSRDDEQLISLKVGCNFDRSLVSGISELNNRTDKVKVRELYGSSRDYSYLSARPDYRLPEVSLYELSEFIETCSTDGIAFNYVMNSPYIGRKSELNAKLKNIFSVIDILNNSSSIITVTNPLLAKVIRDYNKHIKLEVSTIAEINSVNQIGVWKSQFDISKVCLSIYKNRSMRFLENASKFCKENGIEICLITNEFCSLGSKANNGISSCIYRQSCYLCHAQNASKHDDLLFDGYPMSNCMAARVKAISWLQCMYIRPEDLRFYRDLGISQFKITGRTGSTDFILKIVRAYIEESWNGNLLELWKPIQSIRSGKGETEHRNPTYIDNKSLDSFLDFWKDNPVHECANEICGDSCSYCHQYAEKLDFM